MEIAIPEGIEANLSGEILTIKGEKGEVYRKFYHPKLCMEKKENKILIKSKKETRENMAITKTWLSHIKNMFHGVTNGFEYKMKIHHVHFPMNVSVNGNKLVIKNFLGQKEDRTAKIIEGVKVDVKGEEVILTGIDKEKVGQTAANIESTTRLRTKRDRRVFSDGIFIISKGDQDEK